MKSQTNKQKIVSNTMEFLQAVDMTADEVLIQVRYQKERSREFVRQKRKEIEADEKLLNNQKNNPELIGDTTLFNVHTSLMSRSFSDQINVNFRGSTGEEQKTKMFQKMFDEDMSNPEMKMMKYQKYFDKFLSGVAIIGRVGWDGTYKRNKFQVVDPKTWYPDLNGDYLTGNYGYTGFDKLAYFEEMKEAGYMNINELTQTYADNGIQQQKLDSQQDAWYDPQEQQNDIYNAKHEIYMHFSIYNGIKGWALTANNEQTLLATGLVKPGNKFEKADPSLIKFPFVFYNWKPKRYDPFGYRIADYIRDVQINKSKIANLRLDKMKSELYPMYMFNADYVNGKDLGFGFNKFIPVKTGIDGPVNLQNVVAPLIPNTKMDASMAIDATLDRQVEKSTSIGEVAQGTTPEARETATTNSLVQSNTDINLSLNTKIDNISEEYFVLEWAKGYYINFTNADSKIVYSSEWFTEVPIVIKKDDFFIEWNLRISIETSSETESRRNKQRLAFNQTIPLLLQDPGIPEISKRRALRRVWEANNVSIEAIEEEIPKLPDEILQEQENLLLAEWIYVDINLDDDDMAHLIAVEAVTYTVEGMLHKNAHIEQFIAKGKPQQNAQGGWMMNQMAAQWMAQMGSEAAQANRTQSPTTA